MRSLRANCAYGIREYRNLMRKLQQSAVFDSGSPSAPNLEVQIRRLATTVTGDLRTLREQVRRLGKVCEHQRWVKWLFGGLM